MNKTNLVEITISFKTTKEAEQLATRIHECLVGNPDYKASAIVLNVEDKTVTVIIGDEASRESKLYTSCAVNIALSDML